MATKKTPAKKTPAKRHGGSGQRTTASKKTRTDVPGSMPKEGKDPKGGLTATGREYFAKSEGSHLRPGVKGAANTPEKMLRKGSFLRRHFAHPRGPMKDESGEPTRLALSAHAWGEDVPQTMADAQTLAREGHELLEEYHKAKDATEDGERRADTKGRAGSATRASSKGAKKKSRRVPPKG